MCIKLLDDNKSLRWPWFMYHMDSVQNELLEFVQKIQKSKFANYCFLAHRSFCISNNDFLYRPKLMHASPSPIQENEELEALYLHFSSSIFFFPLTNPLSFIFLRLIDDKAHFCIILSPSYAFGQQSLSLIFWIVNIRILFTHLISIWAILLSSLYNPIIYSAHFRTARQPTSRNHKQMMIPQSLSSNETIR